MRIAVITAALAIAAALTGSVARSDTRECQDALDQYNSVVHDVREALRTYGGCVSGSRGHDDCATDFATLQAAQADFEAAVTSYQSDCS